MVRCTLAARAGRVNVLGTGQAQVLGRGRINVLRFATALKVLHTGSRMSARPPASSIGQSLGPYAMRYVDKV